jgi:cytidine deaminase
MENMHIPWELLSKHAWNARNNAYLFGKTAVGAAILTSTGNIYAGCNIEHKFRSHDIHAEVCAVANMISNGGKDIIAILIVAERDFFTPCGGCMDWIIQFGHAKCSIGIQKTPSSEIKTYKASDLMPYYPY